MLSATIRVLYTVPRPTMKRVFLSGPSDSGIPNGIGVCPMLAELGSALSKVTTTLVYELDDPHGSVAQGFPGFEAGSLHTAESRSFTQQPPLRGPPNKQTWPIA